MSRKLTTSALTLAVAVLSATATASLAQARGQLKVIAAPPRTPPAAAVPVAQRQHHIMVQLTRSDGGAVISGPVTIKGMAMVNSGDMGEVDWQVSDSTVSGAVRQTADVVTTFEGTITTAGASGTFTLPAGLRGEWSWDGPLPR